MSGQIPSGLTPINPKKEVIMTTQEKLVKRKLSIIELADFLGYHFNICTHITSSFHQKLLNWKVYIRYT